MRKVRTLATVLLCTATAVASAEQAPAPVKAPSSSPITSQAKQPKLLDTVVVRGEVHGPGLWLVSGGDGHALWILGTLSPLPDGIQWDAADVKALVADSQLVLREPMYSVNVKANLFQQATLGFKFWRAQKNPDGRTLQEVLPPELYARWRKAKARYLPGNSRIERKRPIKAAEALFEAAVRQAHLSNRPVVYPALEDAINQAGLKAHRPMFEVKLSNATAKAALGEIRNRDLSDAQCLATTLDAIESDLPRMVTNANAWANGDVTRLEFSALARRHTACANAMMDPSFSAEYGLPNIKDSIRIQWLTEVTAAMTNHDTTLALVPMENLVGPGNYLDQLRAKGYSVSAP